MEKAFRKYLECAISAHGCDLQHDKGLLNAALHIFLRVVMQSLRAHCPGAVQCDPGSLHLGAMAFIHGVDSSLNTHVHLHVCVLDGVFELPPLEWIARIYAVFALICPHCGGTMRMNTITRLKTLFLLAQADDSLA